jgi:hypothetical protein
MYIIGAEFNFTENTHMDWMLTHKIFVEEIMSRDKLFKKLKKPHSSKSFFESEDRISTSFMKSKTHSTKSDDHNNFHISNNINSQLFTDMILNDDNLKKSNDPMNYFLKTAEVLDTIKKKIQVDALTRPLKIFWVKSDFALVGKIFGLIGTGVAVMASALMKNINFSEYLK